ncbi:MAG: Uma2 family endonuclease [Hyphomicrobiales bacterium]|nr:Uma2 family endonuclease [Hyphomicrobiales bacterium]
MSAPARSPATYADLEAVPPHLVAEILFGSLVTHPRPMPRHSAAGYNLGLELGSPFQRGRGGPGGWIFLPEPELHLGPHVLVPDVAGWRSERLVSPATERAYIDIAPDWICEVLSDSTEKYDKGEKRRMYANDGVDHLWHVDPRVRSLEVFSRRGPDWLLTHTLFDDDDVCAPPFDAVTFKFGLLWPFDLPTPSTSSTP